ncbi:MAG TPA: PQQ-dependent sugar dehydrogenase, partial [Dehalococcoidia bacterium]|nr:PQQ-dependent sugar dehydrogenase [Dehalococcoidia bacterium]
PAPTAAGGSPVPTAGPPSATPTTTPEPATPAPPTPVPLGYRLVPAIPSATFPSMLAFAVVPGRPDEAVIATQTGQLWRVPLSGEGEAALFGDISGRLIPNPGSEEGLLGLAFSPSFERDGWVYLYYSAGPPRRSVLSRFRVVSDAIDPASEQIILEIPQPFANHNGGQIAFGPDGYLYVALGDGGSGGDPLGNAQNLGELLGSILRIDVSGPSGYRVPPDNPFVGVAGARPEIYAYGLRNPWRFSFDRATGVLWAGDVGQNRWEEVDRIVAGGNYGWNIMEGPECFRAAECDRTGLALPRAWYGREDGACAVIGGYVYRGRAMPELDGWFVYGDFCNGRVWAVNTGDESSLPVLLADTGRAISSFGELPDGELIALTFDRAVYRLERAP